MIPATELEQTKHGMKPAARPTTLNPGVIFLPGSHSVLVSSGGSKAYGRGVPRFLGKAAQKTCGRSPERPEGRPSVLAKRYPALKKSASARKDHERE